MRGSPGGTSCISMKDSLWFGRVAFWIDEVTIFDEAKGM